MSRTTVAIGLIVVGVILIVVALGAHAIGLSPNAALGIKRNLLAGLGLLIGVAGGVVWVWKKA